MTVLGGRASGPIYFPGGTRAQDWINVWQEGDRPISRLSLPNSGSRPRQFVVEPAHYAEQVNAIHAHLRRSEFRLSQEN